MNINTDILRDNILDEAQLEKRATREGLGDALIEAGKVNEAVVVVNADLEGSLKVDKFKKVFPKRFFQVGVAEQNMASVGTGLALYGKIPFITSFAAFSPGLNWSQIRLAAMSHANLKVASSHYGLNVGEDGASAQMLEDLALMRVLPEFTVLCPADYYQAKQAVNTAISHQGPVYLRLTRDKFPIIYKDNIPVTLGKANSLTEGDDLTLITMGSLVYESLKAAELLFKEGVAVTVIDMHSIKPLDVDTIVQSLKRTKKLLVAEEHQIAGGLGAAVLEALAPYSGEINFQYRLLAVNDTFGESGPGQALMQKYGLDRNNIYSLAKTIGNSR